jgi:hypothetical protein
VLLQGWLICREKVVLKIRTHSQLILCLILYIFDISAPCTHNYSCVPDTCSPLSRVLEGTTYLKCKLRKSRTKLIEQLATISDLLQLHDDIHLQLLYTKWSAEGRFWKTCVRRRVCMCYFVYIGSEGSFHGSPSSHFKHLKLVFLNIVFHLLPLPQFLWFP